MAYVSQELKARIAPKVKEILNKYSLKGSLSVRHHSTLVLKVKSGSIDFIENFNQVAAARAIPGDPIVQRVDYLGVNPHWYRENFTGRARECLIELMAALNDGNHNHNDIQTDYFNVGWYVDLDIGTWDKPYQLTS